MLRKPFVKENMDFAIASSKSIEQSLKDLLYFMFLLYDDLMIEEYNIKSWILLSQENGKHSL